MQSLVRIAAEEPDHVHSFHLGGSRESVTASNRSHQVLHRLRLTPQDAGMARPKTRGRRTECSVSASADSLWPHIVDAATFRFIGMRAPSVPRAGLIGTRRLAVLLDEGGALRIAL